MARDLTTRERDVLAFMVDSAETFAGDPLVTEDDRRRWHAQVGDAQAGRSCGCGSCPSIEIETSGGVSSTSGERVVLTASQPEASLLLFIDDDRLSYLELAPHGDDVFAFFPAVHQGSAP